MNTDPMYRGCTYGPYEYIPYVQRVYPMNIDPMCRGCNLCTLSIQTLCAEGVPYEPHQYATTTTNDDDNIDDADDDKK